MKNIYIIKAYDIGEIARYTVKRKAEAHCKKYNKMTDKLKSWKLEKRDHAFIEIERR